MKRSQYSESQIVGILKEADAGVIVYRCQPESADTTSGVFQQAP